MAGGGEREEKEGGWDGAGLGPGLVMEQGRAEGFRHL